MEKIEKERKRKLDTRDLVTIGIFSAIYIVIHFIVGFSLGMLGPILTFISIGIVSIVNGTVVILLALKVQKTGVFLILAIIFGLVMIMWGTWWNILIYLVFGLAAELIASKGQHNSKRNLALAFCIFQWGVVFATYFLFYLFRESYCQMIVDQGFVSTLQEAQQYVAIYTPEALIIVIISNIIGAILGAYIGIEVNKKHFEKAGMI